MADLSPIPAPVKPNFRSRITTGSKLLSGVDGRSALGRRYRDLMTTIAAEAGPDLSAADILAISNAATMQLHAEELAAALVRGEAVDAEQLTRAQNAANRAMSAIRRRAAAKPPAKGDRLRAYLASQAEAEEGVAA